MATDELNLAQQSTLPPELYQQQQALNRQQQMAAMLMQQNQQPQGQMVSGRYVPTSFFQNLQPVANMLTGVYLAKQGDTKAAELAKQIREGKAAAEEKIINLMTGTAAVPGQAPVIPQGQTLRDDQGYLTYGAQPGVEAKAATAPDYAAALRTIRTNEYGAGKEYTPTILKQMMPEPTPEERRYKAAIADGSFKGGFNAFLNQMSEADKARIGIERARLGLAQQQQAWDLGLPIGGAGGGVAVGGGSAPQQYQTIGQGSPILAPQGQMPQGQVAPQGVMTQGQMPRFNSKAEQEIWLAGQKKKADLQAEAFAALPAAKASVESGLQAINEMIGDTTVDKKGNVVYGKVQPHPGFNGAVGISGIGSGFGASGYIPGTDVTDFKTRFDQVKGQAFLGAINTLRGTGQITEIEGDKATKAINRMSLAQSESEFVKAANDFRDALNKGYTAAQQKAGVVPMNPTAQPSLGGAQPKFVYDPATGTFK
jgi:hypothetical protein